MVAQPVEAPQLDAQLNQLQALLAAISLAEYTEQTPAQARRNAGLLRRLGSILRTHVTAAVWAVDPLGPVWRASQGFAGELYGCGVS